MVQIRWGSLSVTGRRDNNEDAYVVHPRGGYFLVADGMGGQSAGEKASELATELIPHRLDQSLDFLHDDEATVKRKLDEAVAYANSEIMALSQLEPSYHNMGTTVAFIVVVAGRFYVGGIGDSRVYRLKDKRLEQLTTDHSLTQALLDAGTITAEEAATHRYRNVLYRFLGTKDGGTGADAQTVHPEIGDKYLICSDGVNDGIGEEEIAAILEQHADPQAAANAIVEAASNGGSKDNITCVVVTVE